jgi:iron complex outermembrane receptor protein
MRRMAWLMAALVILALPIGAAAQTENGRITGAVTDESGAVLPGATVTVTSATGAVRTTVTDATGHFVVENLAPGDYEVAIELTGFTKQVSKVTVAAGQSVGVESKLLVGGQAETVQVTGTLIPRPTLEAMSPVTTLEVEELTYRGINRVEDLLTSLPQVFAAQNSTVSNGSSGTATVDLRYLGAQRTLVLLDGRRLPSGDVGAVSPDLNFIPSALVKRVDVLTGGASSVYGADAVAGVVNFVLDRDFEGVRGGFQNAGYQHNNRNDLAQQINKDRGFSYPSGSIWNGAPTDFNVALGGKFGERKGHAAMYIDYRTTPKITKDQRDYTNCSVLGGMTMNGPTCGGSSTWQQGRFQVFYAPSTGLPGSKTYVLDWNSPNGDQLRPRTGADVYNYAPANFMQRPDKRWAGGGFLNFEWNKYAQAYADVMFMDDRTDAQIAPSGDFNNTSEVNCDNPLLSANQRQLLCTAMGYGPTDIATVYIGRRNIEGGGRVDHREHTALRFSFGTKGDLAKGWSYDAFGMQGEVHAPNSYANDLNYSRIQEALLVETGPDGAPRCMSANARAEGCVPWNVFKKGAVTQDALDYLSLPQVQDAGTRTRLVSGRLTGDLKNYGVAFPSAAEGIKVAFGTEYRQEHLFANPDLAFRLALGAGSGGPTLPVDGTYDVKEFFTEALIPFVQQARGAQDLSLELGYRLSDYSTTGRWPTYKVQGSYAPASALKFRVGFNRATRSPNVVELYTAQGLGLGGSQDNCAGSSPVFSQAQCALQGVPANQYGLIAENPANQYNTLGGGNVNLNPEVADTYSGGIVITPKGSGFTVAIDYYNIKIKDTIGSLGSDDIQNQCAATGSAFLCGLIHRDRAYTLWLTTDAYTVTTNQNVGKLESEGIDMNATYTKSLGSSGAFTVNLIGTVLRHQKIDTGLYAYDCKGYFGNQCGIPTPTWRHLTRFTWETPFKATFNVGWRMVGKVTNDDGSPNPAIGAPDNVALLKANDIYQISARHYIDLGASYKLGKNYNFIAGVNNVLDKEPPLGPGESANDYGTGFYGTYDPLGRYAHWGLQFTF